MFRSDRPIDTIKEDLLDRGSFAESLADAILAYKNKESIVTALYGAWGSGKSSVINMALERLKIVANKLPKEQRPIIIRFNPWNYSDQNQLLTQFFRELSVVLKRKDYGVDAAKAGKQLEVYSEFFKPLALIPEPTGLASFFAITMSKVLNLFGKAASKWGELKSKDLTDIRSQLDELLAKQQRKILIIIDDIDRLNNAETRQIFQLIKVLGDFPNTVYLLAFDREIVVNALQKVQEGPGGEYLEKIVQIPFEMPVISKQEVERLLFRQLDELVAGIPEDKWDRTYWGNIYHSGLRYFFGNIRDVTRYINSLRFAFSMVKDEVKAVDFLAITVLQVFEPAVYSGIRDNKDLFAGVFGSGYRSRDAEVTQAKTRCDEVMQRAVVLEGERLKEFLERLFPKLESIYSNRGYGNDWLESWRRTGRVCSPDVFDTFFRLSISKGDLSQKEIEAILGMGGDQQAFAASLQKLNDDGRLVRFLERMQDYTRETIPESSIEPIVKALMDIGDQFPEGRQGMFESGTSMQVLRIMYQLTQRLDTQEKRFEIFKNAIRGVNESLYTIVHEVGVQGQHHGKWTSREEPSEPEEKRPVNGEQLSVLEKLACDKIQLWAEDGRLKDHPKLISILYSWKRWCDDGEQAVKEYVNDMVSTDNGLIRLICAFVSKSYSHGMSDYVERENWRISLKSVADFISVDEIAPKVRAILTGIDYQQLPEENQRALKTFIDTVDGKIEEW